MMDLNFLAAMALIVFGFGSAAAAVYWMSRGDEAQAKTDRHTHRHI